MSTINDLIMEPVEEVFDQLGMMQGEAAPLKRAAFGAALGYGIAFGLKPGFAFDGDKAKPWYFTAKPDEEAISTYVPAWAVVAIPALIFSVLI